MEKRQNKIAKLLGLLLALALVANPVMAHQDSYAAKSSGNERLYPRAEEGAAASHGRDDREVKETREGREGKDTREGAVNQQTYQGAFGPYSPYGPYTPYHPYGPYRQQAPKHVNEVEQGNAQFNPYENSGPNVPFGQFGPYGGPGGFQGFNRPFHGPAAFGGRPGGFGFGFGGR